MARMNQLSYYQWICSFNNLFKDQIRYGGESLQGEYK